MLNFDNLDKHIQKLVDEKAFPSATLCVFHHNQLVKETAYGVYNPETGDVANVDTRYTGLGTLVVQGKDLQLKTLLPEGGQVSVQGEITAIIYEEPRQTGSLWRRLMG